MSALHLSARRGPRDWLIPFACGTQSRTRSHTADLGRVTCKRCLDVVDLYVQRYRHKVAAVEVEAATVETAAAASEPPPPPVQWCFILTGWHTLCGVVAEVRRTVPPTNEDAPMFGTVFRDRVTCAACLIAFDELAERGITPRSQRRWVGVAPGLASDALWQRRATKAAVQRWCQARHFTLHRVVVFDNRSVRAKLKLALEAT